MVPRLELALIKFLGQSDLPNYAHLSSIYPQKSDQNGEIHWEMLHTPTRSITFRIQSSDPPDAILTRFEDC